MIHPQRFTFQHDCFCLLLTIQNDKQDICQNIIFYHSIESLLSSLLQQTIKFRIYKTTIFYPAINSLPNGMLLQSTDESTRSSLKNSLLDFFMWLSIFFVLSRGRDGRDISCVPDKLYDIFSVRKELYFLSLSLNFVLLFSCFKR